MKLITYIVFLYSVLTLSAEVDQFTKRFSSLKDSSEIINLKANEYLKQSILEANEESLGCDEKILYRKMRNYFANHQRGEITIFAIESPQVDRVKLKISESIFKDWSIGAGALISKKAENFSEITLSPLIKLGTHVIGTDKLEHLFGRGYSYFSDYYFKKFSLQKTLKTGIFEEKVIYGGNFLTTGVFSYADLQLILMVCVFQSCSFKE